MLKPQRLSLALYIQEVHEATRSKRDDRLERGVDLAFAASTVGVSLPNRPSLIERRPDIGVLEVDAVADWQRVVGEGIETEQQIRIGMGDEHDGEVDTRRIEAERMGRLTP